MFIKSGNIVQVIEEENSVCSKTLENTNYVLKQDKNGNYYLEKASKFNIPEKIYGNLTKKAHHIFKMYKKRLIDKKSTGVLLSGQKGSGKSLLAKCISNIALEENIPTIIISSSYYGEEFNTFMQSLKNPCIVLFDEFDKLYESKHQQQLLSLLDGAFNTACLYLFTINDQRKIDMNLFNRPGRIFYHLNFNGMKDDEIIEYCNEKLKDKKFIQNIIAFSNLFYEFNFDMLQCLVDELNEFPEEGFESAIEFINAKPNTHEQWTFYVEIYKDNEPCEPELKKIDFNPFVSEMVLFFTDKDGNEDNLSISNENLVKFDSKNKKFVFEYDNIRVVLRKIGSYFPESNVMFESIKNMMHD